MKKCKLCDNYFGDNKELIIHIEKVHNIKIKREKDRISVRKVE